MVPAHPSSHQQHLKIYEKCCFQAPCKTSLIRNSGSCVQSQFEFSQAFQVILMPLPNCYYLVPHSPNCGHISSWLTYCLLILPAPEPLHMLVSLPGTLFPCISTRLSSHPVGEHDVIVSPMASMTTLLGTANFIYPLLTLIITLP